MKTVTKSPSKSRKSAVKVAPVMTALAPAVTAAYALDYFYACLILAALEGQFGPLVAQFYTNAATYHRKAKTAFPRGAYVGAELIAPHVAWAKLEGCRDTGIQNAHTWSRRLYDEMRVALANTMVTDAIRARVAEHTAQVKA
jgi:hypothetical protein